MLQADRSRRVLARLRRAFPLALLSSWGSGGIEQQPGGLWCSYVEVKGSVGTDNDADGHRCAYSDVRCPGVELLLGLSTYCGMLEPCPIDRIEQEAYGLRGLFGRTLQKSIDLTPLLPKAGPTGGLGLACPAPTMSLTSILPFAPGLDIVPSSQWDIRARRVRVRGPNHGLLAKGFGGIGGDRDTRKFSQASPGALH